jgi:hypothetical protein
MDRALGPLSSAEPAELVPSCAGEHVQEKELIVLEVGALPNLKQMSGDGKIALTRCLTELEDDNDRR